MTVARDGWQISRTIPLIQMLADPNPDQLDDLFEELTFTLNSSWRQLRPAAKKEFLLCHNISRVEQRVPRRRKNKPCV